MAKLTRNPVGSGFCWPGWRDHHAPYIPGEKDFESDLEDFAWTWSVGFPIGHSSFVDGGGVYHAQTRSRARESAPASSIIAPR